jgi:hypothetical protein
MCTWSIVYPDPMWAIIGQPVLAPVLIVSSGAAHFDRPLPAGSEAFCSACEALDVKNKYLRVLVEHTQVQGSRNEKSRPRPQKKKRDRSSGYIWEGPYADLPCSLTWREPPVSFPVSFKSSVRGVAKYSWEKLGPGLAILVLVFSSDAFHCQKFLRNFQQRHL